ncbi:MAG: hypothetical protein D6737_13050, partial [Chloroflexi bacterium]
KALSTVERGLYSDTRKQMTAQGGGGYTSSAIMGVVFSAGWTPCIGPVYGAILTMAASGGSVSEAGIMLGAYSLGLGIPFLATALLLDSAQNILRKLQRQMRKIELFSGGFLILIGLLVASGSLQNLSTQFVGNFAELSIEIEEAVTGIFGGDEIFVRGSDAPTTLAELAGSAPPVEGFEVGNLAPNFETVLADGTPISLHDLRGQVVALNFWATWCGPCRIEMPEFQKIFEKHGDDGFTILAVDNQESVEDVVGFAEELGLTFPLAMDERGDIQDQYGIFSYPSTYIIDRDGVIIQKHFGPLGVDQMEPMILDALAAS